MLQKLSDEGVLDNDAKTLEGSEVSHKFLKGKSHDLSVILESCFLYSLFNNVVSCN